MPTWLISILRIVWKVKSILDWLTTVLPDPRNPSERYPMGGAGTPLAPTEKRRK